MLESEKTDVTRCNRSIVPRRHSLRRWATGRPQYPFAAMIVGDFFVIDSEEGAVKARNALATFYRKTTGRKFNVLKTDNFWTCTRIK